jgi:hypothetical protein
VSPGFSEYPLFVSISNSDVQKLNAVPMPGDYLTFMNLGDAPDGERNSKVEVLR